MSGEAGMNGGAGLGGDAPSPEDSEAVSVTYHGEIMALIRERCAACHRDEAPRPSADYESARSMAEVSLASIEQVNASLYNPDCRDYQHSRDDR